MFGPLGGKHLLGFLSGGNGSLVQGLQLVDLRLMRLNFLLAGGSLLRLVLGNALQHFDLHMVLVDLGLQGGSPEGVAIPVHQQLGAFGGVLHHEAAQDLGGVVQRGLGVTGGQILILNVKEGCLVAQSVALLCQLLGVGHCLVVVCHVLFGVFQGVHDVLRGNGIQRAPVVHGAAGSLFVQLQEHTAQRRLAAAGLAYEAQCLALVNINGNVLICPDIHLLCE